MKRKEAGEADDWCFGDFWSVLFSTNCEKIISDSIQRTKCSSQNLEVRDHHHRCTTCSEVHDLFPFPQFAFSEMEESHDDWNTLFSISVGDLLCQRVPLCLRAVKVRVRVPPLL